MTDFLNLCKQKNNKISIYPLHEDWVDVGSKEELKKTKKKFNKKIKKN